MKRMKGWKILGMLLIVTALVCFGILAFIVTDTGGDMTSFIRTVPEKKSGKKEKLMIPIDWGKLHKTNADVYAWIRVPGTDIDYPILQAAMKRENDFYLHHDMKGDYSFAGCIYTRRENKKDFSDRLTVIYGHNMINGSMFGTLRRFEDADFFKHHKEFYIYMPQKILKYRIVAYMIQDDTDILERYQANNELGFEAYVKELKKARNIRKKEKIKPDDSIVTLSTCDSKSGNRRLLQGVLQESESLTTKN